MLDTYAAVVLTGGSSGIGKSFIEHIGRLCPGTVFCNLSRRDPHEENSLPAELKLRHFACDLAKPAELGEAASLVLAHLHTEVPNGRVLLINNAGFGAYGRFPDPDVDHLTSMVDVNVRAVVDLTARLLPMLRARGGAIVNVASTAAFQPTAYLSTYGATKAFVLHWSLGLAEELRSERIPVLALCPGPTATAFFRRAGLRPGTVPKVLGQSSDEVVRAALRALQARRCVVVTGWKNKLLAATSSKLPKTWAARLGAMVLARVRLNAAAP